MGGPPFHPSTPDGFTLLHPSISGWWLFHPEVEGSARGTPGMEESWTHRNGELEAGGPPLGRSGPAWRGGPNFFGPFYIPSKPLQLECINTSRVSQVVQRASGVMPISQRMIPTMPPSAIKRSSTVSVNAPFFIPLSTPI